MELRSNAKVLRQLEGLEKTRYLQRMVANGEGSYLVGPPFKTAIQSKLDYWILLGRVPTHTIYRYLTKLKIGGILVAEVEDKDATVVRQIIEFLTKVASQQATYYFVDGVRYLFVTRLEK
jgi:hypothetical protein